MSFEMQLSAIVCSLFHFGLRTANLVEAQAVLRSASPLETFNIQHHEQAKTRFILIIYSSKSFFKRMMKYDNKESIDVTHEPESRSQSPGVRNYIQSDNYKSTK